jgi:CubicO group peptidase (beta-lactamase class C family)
MAMDRRQFAFGALGLAFSAGAARARAPAVSPTLIADTLKASGTPALAGLVVTPTDIPFIQAAGVRRAESSEPVTIDDQWHLGSNTKAMTAAVYGRLVEMGRARWGATVPELFPDLTTDAAWRTTTVESLMAHRAGLLDEGVIDEAWLAKAYADTRPLPAQRTDVARDAFARAPQGKVGDFSYANADYIIVGAAIERITGKPWEDAIRELLWRPLGLSSAGFGAPMGAEPWGHNPPFFGGDGKPRPLDPRDPQSENPLALGPAGTAHMAMRDYAKWLRLFLTDGGGVLKPQTIRKLTTPLGTDANPYAMGWGVRDLPNGRVLTHSGSNTYWYCTAAVLPERKVAVAAFTNYADDETAAKAVKSVVKALIMAWAPAPAA